MKTPGEPGHDKSFRHCRKSAMRSARLDATTRVPFREVDAIGNDGRRVALERGMDTNMLLQDLAEQFPLSLRPYARRVLVSGADKSLRRLCAGVIRGDSHGVVESADDAVLLEQVRSALADPIRGRHDVLIRDARFDPSAALALLACVRRLDKTLPVVLLVKIPDEIFRRNAHRLGAVLLDAPVESKRLLTIVAGFGVPTAYRRRRAA